MADVFISYAREDRAMAEQLAHVLTASGWSVWWDRRIQVGKHFSRVIEAELDAARCVIVLWSRHAVDSEWVLTEASEGAQRKVLVPVRLDDVKLPLEFRRLHTADLAAWRPGVQSIDFDECVAAIRELAPLAAAPKPDLDKQRERVAREQAAREREIRQRKARKREAAAQTTGKAPSLTIDPLDRTTVDLETTAGTITLEFRPDVAPNHVRNFVDLARSGFYDGTKFHRVIPGFMIQGGDPNTKAGRAETWGTGGSERNIKAEFNDLPHVRGTLSMARSQNPDSASSQFFICDAPSPFLDRQYTVFGKVRSGMEVVDKIAKAPRNSTDRPNDPVTIVKVTVHLPQS